MNCPKCSAYNPSDAVKCRNCGAPMRSPDQRPAPQQRPMGPPQQRPMGPPQQGQAQAPQRRPAPQRPSGDDKKYVVIGGITVVAFIAVIIMLVS
ncbi:MAG: zinc finger Ran-binding domain-containing protein, partial [Oscillospiraceae bacterium]|nr:zinc finger Ran-binding domain-containing protein [Oscillospiraceae bacterium]